MWNIQLIAMNISEEKYKLFILEIAVFFSLSSNALIISPNTKS